MAQGGLSTRANKPCFNASSIKRHPSAVAATKDKDTVCFPIIRGADIYFCWIFPYFHIIALFLYIIFIVACIIVTCGGSTYKMEHNIVTALPPPAEQAGGEPSGLVGSWVVKIWQRCNMACDNCYMYEWADQSFRERPRSMSAATFIQFASRLGEYVETHKDSRRRVGVTLHGGEPTLHKPEFFDAAADEIERNMPEGSRADLSIQTNATRLTPDYLDVFAKRKIQVSVSLDGGEIANDRHRLFANGESTYKATMDGISLINSKREYRELFAGILAVIDLRNNPVEAYRALCDALSHGSPEPVDINQLGLDFLLPLGNWTQPAPGRPDDDSQTPYANWLIKAYDAWTDDIMQGRPAPNIRIFNEIIRRHVSNGKRASLEIFGVDGQSPRNMVVESDGGLHLVDALKTTGPNITDLGLNVYEHDLTTAETKARELAKRLGMTALPQACQDCSVKRICGGGWFVNRYDETHDPPFGRLPVYHPDLLKLITYIQNA